jgi:mRNA interferase RelE/StbE
MPARYAVVWDNAARKQLEDITPRERARILRRVDALADDPRPHGVVKMAGADDRWRIRIGSYRVVYEIVDDQLVVTVVRVGHRGEVYRRL